MKKEITKDGLWRFHVVWIDNNIHQTLKMKDFGDKGIEVVYERFNRDTNRSLPFISFIIPKEVIKLMEKDK